MEENESVELSFKRQKRKRPSVQKERGPFEAAGFAGLVYSMFHDMVCVMAFIMVVFILAVRPVGVSGISMYPTLVGAEDNWGNMGDYLLLRSNFLGSSYKNGDVVVACVPSYENGKTVVKRVVAVGGQTVSFQIGTDACMHVYVDDVLQSEDFIHEPMNFTLSLDGVSIQIPEGCYFLMGDNRNHSLDSRDERIGIVDGRYIVGKALWLLVPGQDVEQGFDRDWDRFGAIYGG